MRQLTIAAVAIGHFHKVEVAHEHEWDAQHNVDSDGCVGEVAADLNAIPAVIENAYGPSYDEEC
jgi:hypothetical protein